jgi:hypothetical protein
MNRVPGDGLPPMRFFMRDRNSNKARKFEKARWPQGIEIAEIPPRGFVASG